MRKTDSCHFCLGAHGTRFIRPARLFRQGVESNLLSQLMADLRRLKLLKSFATLQDYRVTDRGANVGE